MVVGANGDDCAEGGNCGSAYVFRFNGTSWVGEQKLIASDAAVQDDFGFSVSVSGDTTVVGANGDACAAGGACGAAYVFRFNGTSWVDEQELTALDAGALRRFGFSVSVSEGAALVGAKGDYCAAGPTCGSAYVFRFDGSSWAEEEKLTASDAAAGDSFGNSVSVSKDTAVVGAFVDDCAAGVACGSVYVFRFNGTSWVEEQKLTASDATEVDEFGLSVSVDGDTIVVGTSLDDCADGDSCGSAYVYRFNGSSWVEKAKLNASDAAAGDSFGDSVSVSGDIAMMGAPGSDCAAGVQCGSAYVFGVAGDCNRNGIDDVCDIREETSTDNDGSGVPDECECQAPAVPVAETLSLVGDPVSTKNRFLSFTAGDPAASSLGKRERSGGTSQAVRVTFTTLPEPFDVWDGAELWVGLPSEVSESGAVVDPQDAPKGTPTFRAARLQCEPAYTDWAALGVVHVFHEGIVPEGLYSIQVIDGNATCKPGLESNYSDSLSLTTALWGDTITDFSTTPPGPPNATVDIIDATAIIARFVSAPEAIGKARADLEPNCLDLVINITDVSASIAGFQGLSYPFDRKADDPCDSPCMHPLP